MKILRRYILQELWLPFILSLLTLNFIFMAGYLVRAANFIIGRGVPITDTFYVILLAFPDMISYTVPMSLLMGVMIVYGNLSQHNEIRAVKASGVHPMQIIAPSLVVGLILSFFMFVFNDQVANNSSFELRKNMKRMLIKHPKALIEPGRFVKISNNIIFLAKQITDDSLRDIVAYEVGEEDKPIRTILAASGEIVSDPEHGSMQVRLYNGSISDAEEKGVQAIQFQSYEFPTIGQEDVSKMHKKMREYSLAELLMLPRNPKFPKEERVDVRTAFHQRIAFSMACFMFAFIGIPTAILVRRGEIVAGFAISMAAACLYYVLFAGAKTLAIRGVLPPPMALWMPNILLFVIGGYFLRRSFVN
ncbi:MAG: LptF/LptG family permease [Candidatus Omnitrophota bacterium]|nr:LptF/LptG family permease [Candidatus Omnitrophota bacterium]